MHIQFQLAQQCIQISTRINSSSVHTYIFVCSTLRVILQGFVDPIMQHGVRIEAVFASLQQGEHMVESTCFQSSRQVQCFCEQNYFQRRGERRSKERFFNLSSSTVVFPHSYTIPSNTVYSSVFYMQSSRFPVILCYSTYRINSSPRTTRLIPCRHLPATVPRVSKHSTRQNKAPGLPYSIPRPYSTSRLPVNSTR